MSTGIFRLLLWLLALGFSASFVVVVLPALWHTGDLPGALRAGFVNPFASGYALDTIFCWAVLAVWVWYEARHCGVRHGWLALLLGLVPGVSVGYAVYLLVRMRQMPTRDPV